VNFRSILVVSIGGIVGSLLRWLISLPVHENGLPGGTLLVNFLGSGILFYSLLYFQSHPSTKWWWRPAIASGFCGGFTTYSAFAVQVEKYLAESEYGAALLYVLVSLIGTYLILQIISRKVAK
jgi:CrcB protein